MVHEAFVVAAWARHIGPKQGITDRHIA
jgi:hypothetical protein